MASKLIETLNPSFKAPQRPFTRLDYRQAIAYLQEHEILCEDEETHEMRPHRVGDDIAEAAERKMTDQMGVPVFLTRFPKEIKAFYMKLCPGDEAYTESCDLLMPGVGEIVGGSMRITEIAELLAGYKREGIDPSPYYWFVSFLANVVDLHSIERVRMCVLGSPTSESTERASTVGTVWVLSDSWPG